jgi:hypothetical protein
MLRMPPPERGEEVGCQGLPISYNTMHGYQDRQLYSVLLDPSDAVALPQLLCFTEFAYTLC